jgi:tetratricopeptide (TPR) repeat protein
LGLCCCQPKTPLPPVPDLAYQNEISKRRITMADAEAGENPRSAESSGRLAMLYHAYQFFDQARVTYERTRELAPDEFRYIYYLAMLEKTTFHYERSEALFRLALDKHPRDPELWAELGDLYLMWNRRDDAAKDIDRALDLDPLQPVAALGKARLLTLKQDWKGVIDLLSPLLERYPRLSKAHQFLAAAQGALGQTEKQKRHQELGEYGYAVESPLMNELNELTIDAIMQGDPSPGYALLQTKCAKCHNHERIYDHDEEKRWWARTVRRMQRKAGWKWLTDDQAASVVAYLSQRKNSSRTTQ